MKNIVKFTVAVAVLGTLLIAEKGPGLATTARVDVPSSQIVSGQESNIGIDILSDNVVSGVQIRIQYDANKIILSDAIMSKSNTDFSIYSRINENQMTILAFSMTGATLNIGEGAEISIPAKAAGKYLGDVEFEMVELILASPDAEAINADFYVGDVSVIVDIPTVYGIDQNYPNPFNPTTTINYQLPQGNAVTLVIYNMLGQVVNTLVDETKEAGYYSVVWDGMDSHGKIVSSGEYICSINASNYTENIKMVFLK